MPIHTVYTSGKFEWDIAKDAANVDKHGLNFDYAIRIFAEPVLERIDQRRDYGEVRIIPLGVVDDLELTIVFTERGGRRRIISARRAHNHERRAYREAYPNQSDPRQD